MKRILCVLGVSGLMIGCGLGDTYIKKNYEKKYTQNPKYVKMFEEKIKDQHVNELALEAAQADKARMRGQSRLKLDDSIYIENVSAQNNAVVFEYSLTDHWFKRSATQQQQAQLRMQKDLIYRTCSLKTVALAQQKGLEEVHNYYRDYPSRIEFTLKTNLKLCKQYGFVND